MNSTLRPDHQCSALCGMYALPTLLVCDMNPSSVNWINRKPHSAIIDGERMSLSGTFLGLEHHGYITFEWSNETIKVTDLGTEALRAWNNGEAGL